MLPSLPSAWSMGFIKGIKARGGFELDIYWEKNCLKEVTITSNLGKRCRVRTATPVQVFWGNEIIPVEEEEGVVSFETSKGEKYKLVAESASTS